MRASSSFLSSPTVDDTAARRPKKNDQSKVFVFFLFQLFFLAGSVPIFVVKAQNGVNGSL